MPKLEKNMSIFTVFADCRTSLRSMVSRYLSHHNDVDDILQETFARTYAADKNGTVEFPKRYLFKTAKHLAYRENSRVSTRLTSYLDDVDDFEATAPDINPLDTLTEEQEKKLLLAALNQLPEQCRHVTRRRLLHGMKVQEIAEELDISLSTAEKHLAKGIERCDRYIREIVQDGQSARTETMDLKQGRYS